MSSLAEQSRVWSSPHTVGGWGYTHSIPNYGRVLREGLDSYAVRVAAGLQRAEQSMDAGQVDFYLGLSDVVEGIRSWHRRLVATLENWLGETDEAVRRRGRLLEALWQVPFKPARSFYEALVAYNLVFYMDDCDNPGRIDRELFPYYQQDIAAGGLARDHARALLRAFTDNVAANDAWSAAIGGSLAGGDPAYNAVTRLCLEAVHHRHRPSYELGVRADMPDAIWDAALDAVATGCGQPAFYNDQAYIQSLMGADLGVAADDVVLWNGGGCTETMIHGCSNVGSLDGGFTCPLSWKKRFSAISRQSCALTICWRRSKRTWTASLWTLSGASTAFSSQRRSCGPAHAQPADRRLHRPRRRVQRRRRAVQLERRQRGGDCQRCGFHAGCKRNRL